MKEDVVHVVAVIIIAVIIVAIIIGISVRSRRRRERYDLTTLVANEHAKKALEAENDKNLAHNPEAQQYMNDGVNSPRNRPF